MASKSMQFKLNNHWYKITKSINGIYKFLCDNQPIDRKEFSTVYKQYSKERVTV